ncbi:putative rhamnosyltransferase [Hasllibacter halocynthiae]|uniref:Putative rhamnosyltransferase n=1 Tax=Hasllibacter halocynthiae TaxID=595589 RepID=A0A2T0X3F6_9RHOB|nr:glycosyltransferase [Hasllibacter halocynthiae]PRY93470.1 putative rhamnosyltransferase [Hasllibacter halocynthiae]
MRPRIVALVRFSYVARGGFSKGGGDPATLLFDRARLERRFRLFEALCLPSLRAQADGAFETIVLTARSLPAWARDRLERLVDTLPGGRVVAMDVRFHYAAVRAAFASLEPRGETHRVTLRLDDDDALATDCVARMRALAPRAAAVEPDAPVSISFNRGYYAHLGEGRVYEVVERLPLGIGMGLVAPAGHPDNAFARNHRFMPQFFNHWSEAGTPMWIRTIHGDNDAEPTLHGRRDTAGRDGIEAAMAARFHLTLRDLEAL